MIGTQRLPLPESDRPRTEWTVQGGEFTQTAPVLRPGQPTRPAWMWSSSAQRHMRFLVINQHLTAVLKSRPHGFHHQFSFFAVLDKMFIFIQVKYIYFYSFHSEYPVTTKALKIGGHDFSTFIWSVIILNYYYFNWGSDQWFKQEL